MPALKHQVKTITKDGEITINLNLQISLNGGNIQITAEEEQKPETTENPVMVPDELFDDIPIAFNFGKK